MQTSRAPSSGWVIDAHQRQPESAESSGTIQAEHHRAHDPQRMLESLIANRRDVLVAFRAAFAAHHFDVTGYTDDEIGRAICSGSGPPETLTSHERLTQAFAHLQPAR